MSLQVLKKLKFEYRISILYLGMGVLWIILSDVFFNTVIDNKQILTFINITKGFLYVLFTSILLFYLVRKHMNMLHLAKLKAEENDRLKSAFLANMSHEIRTPMNGILGFADLLKQPKLTGEEQQEYINIIQKSGVRMLNIINDIISISKVEAGQMEIKLSETNINEQIEYIYTFFKPEVDGKGLHIFLKNGLPKNEALIITDREKIYAILTNLVKNAIKYTNEGSIELGYVLRAKNEPAELEFFIKDTGIGVSNDRQEAIFERFVQGDIADTAALQGAGLGLAITKAYVEMLGGKIWMNSKFGSGSIFYFTIPYRSKQKIKGKLKNVLPWTPAENEIKKLTILIVEDDDNSEKLLSMIIKKYSSKILKAKTGFDAIDLCLSNPDIDLILMDIKMPDMDGYEATRQIRLSNKEVIIIAQTGYGLTGDRDRALDAGCNDYISKPIVKDELIAMINKYFNKSKGLNIGQK